MNPLKKYKLKTHTYTATFILGIAWIGYTLYTQQWILLILGTLFTLVSLDNIFCGLHAKACGYSVNSHYVIPPFWKGQKPEDKTETAKEDSE